MNITVWVPWPYKVIEDHSRNFIVQTITALAKNHPADNFYLLTRPGAEDPVLPNIQVIIIKDVPSNPVLKKIWDIKMAGRIKKLKADLLISLDDSVFLSANIPQCLLAGEGSKPKQSYLKKADSIIVNSEAAKRQLAEKFKLAGNKIAVVYPFPGSNYRRTDPGTKEKIKKEYSDGNEFFFYNSSFAEKEDIISLLKSFSHFKKRQKSSFQLLISTAVTSFFQKSLEGYKYRSDVKFVDPGSITEITSAAYAVVLPFNTSQDIVACLDAMRSGVPVITVKGSGVSEIAGEAGIYAETNAIKEIGERLMQVYINENYRAEQIEKGKLEVAKFTPEKTAVSLWQAVMRTVK